MLLELLTSHLRMRASLVAIRDLDPAGITARIAEMDAEIERLRALIEREREGDGYRASAKSRTPALRVA